jgi:hypothetical protein
VSPLESLRSWVHNGVSRRDRVLGDRFKKFIDTYSGTSEQPLPFAGRDKDLRRLHDWLPKGGLLFVTGRAGIGKSALLLHFASDIVSKHADLTVLFLPISIRFETADELSGLRLLYLQLSALFSELRLAESASDYRDRIQKGWESIANRGGRHFLLVVDGADEATGGWIEREVLPYEVPGNLSMIVSARSTDDRGVTPEWLVNFRSPGGRCVAALRESLILEPLSKDAVKEAVVQLGHPLDELAERDAVIEELYKLTDLGDPLLVSLWVSQLWRSRDQVRSQTADQLRRFSPGISGFLDVWFKEQQSLWKSGGLRVSREDFEPLLYLFALAQGPLTASDMSALAKHHHLPNKDEDFLEHVLENASRLLVRSGTASGFSFVHPRLGFHYRDVLQQRPGELKKLRQAFIEWGRETVERLNRGELSPERCTYLLHHYTWHVLDAALPKDQAIEQYLLPLMLKPGWHQFWHEIEGAYGGFLSDLARVEQVLRSADSGRYLGRQLHCLLCRSSIRSLTSNIPEPLFAHLVDCNRWSVRRALRMIEHLDSVDKRAAALVAVAAVAVGDDRIQLLEQALEAAQAIPDEWARVHALAAMAKQLSGHPQLLERALEVAQAIEFEVYRAQALAAVAEQLGGHPQLLEQALKATQAIQDEGSRAYALRAVAGQLEGEKQREALEQALEAVRAIRDESGRALALAAVAGQLEGVKRREALEQALEAARAIHAEWGRAQALAAVAGQLEGQRQREVLEQALEVAQRIPDEWTRVRALAEVAKQLRSHPQLLERALGAAQAILDEGSRAYALTAVAEQLGGHPQLLEQALEAAQAIPDEWARVCTLVELAKQLVGEKQREALELALQGAQATRNESRAQALAAVAGQLEGERQREALEQALEAARAIPDEWSRVCTLVELAKQLVGEKQREALELALQAAQATRNESRAQALAIVAEQLRGHPQLVEQALEAARAIRDEGARVAALASVAEQMDGERKREVLEQALEAAQAIPDERARVEALAPMAEQLGGHPELLEQALKATQAIRDEEGRAQALAAVTEQLRSLSTA